MTLIKKANSFRLTRELNGTLDSELYESIEHKGPTQKAVVYKNRQSGQFPLCVTPNWAESMSLWVNAPMIIFVSNSFLLLMMFIWDSQCFEEGCCCRLCNQGWVYILRKKQNYDTI